jgi:membrane protease YdiL (CAAX protease family)
MNPLQDVKPSLIKSLLEIFLLLSGIQVIRFICYRTMALAGSATGWFQQYGDITNELSILITGLIIWLIFRPPLKMIGITGFTGRSGTKIVEVCATILLLILAVINLVLDLGQVIPTLVSCLIFPLFEEPLFRGWIWNKVSPTISAKWNGLLCVLLTATLFAIWHLGYWDVVALHVKPGTTFASMQHIMWMKMVISSIIGVVTGLLRWKTGNIYASILFHATWNLFGR